MVERGRIGGAGVSGSEGAALVTLLAHPGRTVGWLTFGLARYGYGLLLPEMQDDLGVDARTGGLIASGSYVAYLLGNTAVVWLTGRFGPRLPLGMAAATAAVGMAAISAAAGPSGLAVGVLVCPRSRPPR